MWPVLHLPGAEAERQKLTPAERAALNHAVEKRQELGSALDFRAQQRWPGNARRFTRIAAAAGPEPSPSHLPARGQCPRHCRGVPEAVKDPKGFRPGCADGLNRLAELDEATEEDSDHEAE